MSLADTRVTDTGLRFLTETRNLEYLNLDGTDITGSILETVGQLPRLRSLRLWDTRLGDDTLRHLHGMSQLRSVALDDEAVTASGLLDLIESLPNLVAIWVGLTPFLSRESIGQLKDRLRQAPSGAHSLRKEERRPSMSGAASWPGTWTSEELPAHTGRSDIGSIASTTDGVVWVARYGFSSGDDDTEPSWRQPGWSPPAKVCALSKGQPSL